MELPRSRASTSRTVLVLFLLHNLQLISANDFTNGCNSQPCWEQYEQANTYYQADVPTVKNRNARLCAVLRTYKRCLNELKTSPECIRSLNYQGSVRALETRFDENQCADDGPVYPDGPEPEIAEPVIPCQFKGRPIYNYCALFGDPHLITFGGLQMTCKLEGAWPLIDNKFLTVQVTNTPLAVSTKSATVSQKVTVIVKGIGPDSRGKNFCGSQDAVFYHAEVGSLPSTFTDGLKEYGKYKSIQVKTVTPGQQVELYLRYIDSTVIIRQIDNQYLSVGIRMPEEVVNGTLSNPDDKVLRQLCFDSCPLSERVNIIKYLSEVSTGNAPQKLAYSAAVDFCKGSGVTDYFFDSCVFDILMTGKQKFTSMAVNAYQDVRQYASRQPRWTNRTSLQYHNKSSNIKPSNASNASKSISMARCHYNLLRTFLFVYIMHIVSVKFCG